MKLFWPLLVLGMSAASQPAGAASKPDLVVHEIRQAGGCRATLVIGNRGPGTLPASASHHLAYQLYEDGAAAGGRLLIDAELEHLRQPGGTIEVLLNRDCADGAQVRAVVDFDQSVAEANEENNSLTTTWACQREWPGRRPGLQPDLTVEGIEQDRRDCSITAKVANRGAGRLPASAWGRVGLQAYKGTAGFGGWPLSDTELEKLKEPGGTAIVPLRSKLAQGETAEVRVDIDSTQKVAEANETNNSFTKSLTCAPEPQTKTPQHASYDLAVSGIAFGENCQLILMLRNQGPDEFVLSEVREDNPTFLVLVNGRPVSATGLGPSGLEALRQPGSSLLYPIVGRIDGTAEIKAKVSPGAIPDRNEANNVGTAVLTCRKSPIRK